MTRFLLAGTAACGLLAGAAMAQTSTSVITTTSTPTLAAPTLVAPESVTSGASTGNAVRSDGDRISSSSTSFKDSNGEATAPRASNTSYPFSNLITTTKKTISTVNGVTTETETTTQAYPPGTSTVAPTVTTTSR